MGLRGNLVIEIAIRAVLLAVYILTDYQTPFTRVIQPEEWWLYKNPHTASSDVTITTPQLFWLVIFVPCFIMISVGLVSRSMKGSSCSILGLTMSLLLNGIITNGIKLMVGRPRPDFYERCFPDGKQAFEGITPLCTGDSDVIIEGRKSFPSGHSSWSFAGLLYLSLYLAGQLRIVSSSPPRSLPNFLLALCPCLLGLFIALSRYCDYWHHYQDIVWGSVIGAVIATISYHYYHYPLWDWDSDTPRGCEISLPNKSVSRVKDIGFIPRSSSSEKLQNIKIM